MPTWSTRAFGGRVGSRTFANTRATVRLPATIVDDVYGNGKKPWYGTGAFGAPGLRIGSEKFSSQSTGTMQRISSRCMPCVTSMPVVRRS
jgi:hypothetical protein